MRSDPELEVRVFLEVEMAIVFTRKDLDMLSDEIKFLSPRYQEMVTALVHAALQPATDATAPAGNAAVPDVLIVIDGPDNETLPPVREIVDSAYQRGPRGSGSDQRDGKVGKVGRWNLGKVGRQIYFSHDEHL